MNDRDTLTALMQTNEVFRDMRIYAEVSDGIARRNGASVICCGPTGIGKDYTIDEACLRHNTPIEPLNPGSPQGLIAACKAKPRAIFKCAEMDAAFRSLEYADVIKRLTEPTAPGQPRVISHALAQSTVPFKSWNSLIILTNLNVKDATLFDKKIYEAGIVPILRRCAPIVLSFKKREVYDYTCYLVVCENAMLRFNYPLRVINASLRFMAKYYHRLDPSPGEMRSIAFDFLHYPEVAEAKRMMSLKPEPAGKLDPVPVYQIELPPNERGTKKQRKAARRESRVFDDSAGQPAAPDPPEPPLVVPPAAPPEKKPDEPEPEPEPEPDPDPEPPPPPPPSPAPNGDDDAAAKKLEKQRLQARARDQRYRERRRLAKKENTDDDAED